MAENPTVKAVSNSVASSPPDTASSATETPRADLSRSQSETSRTSGLVKRALTKTTDKISRRVSNDGKSLSQSQITSPSKGHKNLFSLRRSKGNLNDFTGEVDSGASRNHP